MAYIPEEHQKYDILPAARQNNWEVFAYDSQLLATLQMSGCRIPDPYHPESYEAYYAEIDQCISLYPDHKDRLLAYRNSLIRMNDKHQWGIIRYHGPSDLSFTDGRYYYVPIFPGKDGKLVCGGIIDDDEFTDYIAWEPSDLVTNFEHDEEGNLWVDEPIEFGTPAGFEPILDPYGLVSARLEGCLL